MEEYVHLLLLRSKPSGTALLDWLSPRIDNSMLWEIAAADYGYMRGNHRRAIRRIRDRGEIPVPLRWFPREVLELMRWSEPDASEGRYGSAGTRGHLIRAFCCAVLLRAADDPETQPYTCSENEDLAQLLASVLRLGREASENALHFLAWRLLRLPPEHEEYPFFALGLLLLWAALFEPGQESTNFEELAAWVVREEARTRQTLADYVESDQWLLGLTNFDQRHEVWRRLAQEILLDPAKGFPQPAASALRGIVNRLVPDA